MNPLMLRPKTQLLLAVVLPLVCVLVGLILLWPTVSHLRAARRQLEETQGTIAQKKLAITQAEAVAGGRSLALAVALPTEEEPIDFLKKFAAHRGERRHPGLRPRHHPAGQHWRRHHHPDQRLGRGHASRRRLQRPAGDWAASRQPTVKN
jgi:hypothetical protein